LSKERQSSHEVYEGTLSHLHSEEVGLVFRAVHGLHTERYSVNNTPAIEIKLRPSSTSTREGGPLILDSTIIRPITMLHDDRPFDDILDLIDAVAQVLSSKFHFHFSPITQ
jgi:hypothetical protein